MLIPTHYCWWHIVRGKNQLQLGMGPHIPTSAWPPYESSRRFTFRQASKSCLNRKERLHLGFACREHEISHGLCLDRNGRLPKRIETCWCIVVTAEEFKRRAIVRHSDSDLG